MEKINLAIEQLQQSKMIIVTDNENRENEGDIIFAAEFANVDNINFCLNFCSGVICVAINEEIANRLELNPMQKQNTDPFHTAFYSSLDADPKYGITTGISAKDRAKTIQMIADEKYSANDFKKPGHIFPILSKKHGILQRQGHTESAVDLMKFANLKKASVICELRDFNGDMLKGKKLEEFSIKHDLLVLTTKDIEKYSILNTKFIEKQSESNLPTEFGNFRISVYKNLVTNVENIMLTLPNNNLNKRPFVRIHSECITGEVFYSLKCDCKQQLENAMKLLQERQNGAIIYLKNHEGRGIGLSNKINAYSLQDKGFNTFESNDKLGFEFDMRDYKDAVGILKDIKLNDFDIYTGNTNKINFLTEYGFNTTQIVPNIKTNECNINYMLYKKNELKYKYIINNDISSD